MEEIIERALAAKYREESKLAVLAWTAMLSGALIGIAAGNAAKPYVEKAIHYIGTIAQPTETQPPPASYFLRQ